MIHIITAFYVSKTNNTLDIERTSELFTCLQKNIENVLISKIHLFLDDADAMDKINTLSDHMNFGKIVIVEVGGGRKKHSDYFRYAITNLKDELCMIMNSDIYLYEFDISLLDRFTSDKATCFALTRYEDDFNDWLITNYKGSHDAYLFRPSLLDLTVLELVDFYPNLFGIESRIINALCQFGYTVFNPCYQIKIVHLHKSGLRPATWNWIGLHRYGDDEYMMKSCWYVKPVKL